MTQVEPVTKPHATIDAAGGASAPMQPLAQRDNGTARSAAITPMHGVPLSAYGRSMSPQRSITAQQAPAKV